MSADPFPAFTRAEVAVDDGTVYVRTGGCGPTLLLLHGFPQTHLMWRAVAPRLARRYTIVCADLPGYGASRIRTDRGVAAFSKRAFGARLVQAMHELGHERFAVIGHDRGGRVAYRMALDHPTAVTATGVLDVIPTGDAWARADDRFAVAYWPWSLLAQPEPLPERILATAADAIVDHALDQWGSHALTTPGWVRDVYVDALRQPGVAHTICQEYRAAATVDIDHDRADQVRSARIRSPLLVLWAQDGPLDTWYSADGGPMAIWRRWADDVHGRRLPGGHFFPEHQPVTVADALDAFLRADPAP